MRPIHIARLDKSRPVLVLTRELVRPYLNRVTVALITGRVRGLSTEVHLSSANGVDGACVVNCDNISTIEAAALGRQIGFLLPTQEPELSRAIQNAFDLLGIGTA